VIARAYVHDGEPSCSNRKRQLSVEDRLPFPFRDQQERGKPAGTYMSDRLGKTGEIFKKR